MIRAVLATHIFVGAVIWMLLDRAGKIKNTFVVRRVSKLGLVGATLLMIVGWPWFIGRRVWLVWKARGLRQVAARARS